MPASSTSTGRPYGNTWWNRRSLTSGTIQHHAHKLLGEALGRVYAGGYSQLKLAVAPWREEHRERAFVRFDKGLSTY